MYVFVVNVFIFTIEKCPQLPDPDNGSFEYFDEGKVAIIQCDSGYKRKGPLILRCNEGMWPNQPLPTCEKI